MATNINISKNHFYKKQAVSVDIELNGTYPDDYAGGSNTTVNVGNGRQNRYYLYETIVPSVDKSYTKNDEMYLQLDVNTVESDTSYIPSVLIYNVKDVYSLTEGTLTPLDKKLSVYHSKLQPETPLVVEEFDGSNKGFGRDEKSFTLLDRTRRITPSGDFGILWSGVKKIHSDATVSIQQSKFVDDALLFLEPSAGTTSQVYDEEGRRLYNVVGAENWTNSNYILKKALEIWTQDKYGAQKQLRVEAESITGPGSIGPAGTGLKDSFNDTYLSTITAYNTIFNNVHKEHNVYDIKVQTLEGVGSDTYAFSMNNFDLTSDDSLIGGTSARMHLFWENYSGAATGADAKALANCYGMKSNVALPQTMYGCISNIPVQRKLDLISGSSGNPTSAFAMPEIEIVFKVKQLAPALRNSSTHQTTLARSINFVLSNTHPKQNETLWEYTKRLQSNLGDASYMHLAGVVNGAVASGSFSMFDIVTEGSVSGFSYNTATGLPAVNASGTCGYHKGVEVPFNEWVTMRLRQWKNGESMLVYFPELPLDGNGTVPCLVVDGGLNFTNRGGISNMLIGISNFRATNATVGGDTNNINYNYGVDLDGGENDRQVEMLIDSIKFLGFNHTIKNLSKGKSSDTYSPLILNADTNVKVNPSSEFSPTDNMNARASKVNSDNYFTLAKVPSPNIVSFGFDSINSLDDTFLLFQNYTSPLGAASEEVQTDFIKWGYSHSNINTGPLTDACINLTQTTDIETDGALFVDNFSKKGFVKITASGVDSTNWKARENPWVSAVITHVSEDGRTIQVDNPEIFDEPVGLPSSDGQPYVCYKQSTSQTGIDSNINGTYAKTLVGTGSVGQVADDLYQIKPRDGNTIYLNKSLLQDDDGGGNMLTTTYGGANPQMHRCLISPKKYWLWAMIQTIKPQSTSARAWGEWSGAPSYSGSTLPFKSYDSVNLYANTGTIGSTYNEYLYNDGAYQNRWNLNYLDSDNILDMSQDYGYGAYQAPSGDDPAKIGGYIQKESIASAGTNYLSLNNYMEKARINPSDKLSFAIYPTEDSALLPYNVNFDSAEGTTVPQVIYGFDTELPQIDELTVSPRFDFIKEDAQISKSSKSNSTDVIFNWKESKNVEYRVLFVDTTVIRNKYHKALFIAPLNDSGSTAKAYTSANNYVNGTSITLTGDANTPDIEGAQGYASKFAGSTQLTQTTNTNRIGADNFTIMATLKPTDKAGSSDLDVALEMSKTTTTDSNFALGVDNVNKIQFKVTGSTKLTSTTAYAMDGVEQLNVIVTYDKSLDTDNLKLYVNGKLEDTADYTTSFEPSGRIYIGADIADSNFYSGFVEEISTHSITVYVVPNAKQFILPTKTLDDLSSGESNKYQARMFVFDNTNIRGFNKDEVGTSNTASWKITGVA